MTKGADWYDQVYTTGGNDGMYNLPADQFPEYRIWMDVLQMIPKKNLIVELGCGVGMFGDACYWNGYKYYVGFDFSSVAIAKAKDRRPTLSFIRKDLLDFKGTGLYDTVVMFEVLEHIEYDLALLTKLRAGTQLFITVPNFDSESHHRYFKTLEDACYRYSMRMDITWRNNYPMSDEHTIFLIGGMKT